MHQEAASDGSFCALDLLSMATPTRSHVQRQGAAGRDLLRGPASKLETLMWRQGVEAAWEVLAELHQRGETSDRRTLSRMLVRTLGGARERLDRKLAYRGIVLTEAFLEMRPWDVDEVLFNVLLDACSRLGDLGRLEATLELMQRLGVHPSAVTLGILVKTYGQRRDIQKVLRVWDEMEAQRDEANVVTYCCMIEACVKCRHLRRALQIFGEMRQTSRHRNTILYCTLIKGYGAERDFHNALELFREMSQEGVPYNTVAYNSILDVCIKCGELATAERLLREMLEPESSVKPDLITFSTVLKGYCQAGDLEEALQVAVAIKDHGLQSDELVYNTLMDACVKAGDVAAGVGLFEEMVQSGVQPSAATHRILQELYQQAGYENEASCAVAELFRHYGMEQPCSHNHNGCSRKPGAASGKAARRSGRRSVHAASPVLAGSAPEGSPARSSGSSSTSSRNPGSGRPTAPCLEELLGELPMQPARLGSPVLAAGQQAMAGAFCPAQPERGQYTCVSAQPVLFASNAGLACNGRMPSAHGPLALPHSSIKCHNHGFSTPAPPLWPHRGHTPARLVVAATVPAPVPEPMLPLRPLVPSGLLQCIPPHTDLVLMLPTDAQLSCEAGMRQALLSSIAAVARPPAPLTPLAAGDVGCMADVLSCTPMQRPL